MPAKAWNGGSPASTIDLFPVLHKKEDMLWWNWVIERFNAARFKAQTIKVERFRSQIIFNNQGGKTLKKKIQLSHN